MKVYISTDMEGISGVLTWEQVGREGKNPEYENARHLLTQDVNAAVQGAISGGAEEVVVMDGHSSGFNFVLEELDPRASYITGPTRVNVYPGLDESFDAVYTSDVLGHVEDVRTWLLELNRVLKSNGVLAMFSESKLGKHAWLRNYLFKRGLNVDPHENYHISLYSRTLLHEYIEEAGFYIKRIYSAFWASFLVHPDEFYEKLQSQKKFPVLRCLNKILFLVKKKTHPVSTALGELYGLVEMLTLGRWLEAQGYIILAKKK